MLATSGPFLPVGVTLPALGSTLPPAGVVVLGGAALGLVLLRGRLVGAASVAVALGGSVAFLVATHVLIGPPVWRGGAFHPLLAGSPAEQSAAGDSGHPGVSGGVQSEYRGGEGKV